MSASQKLNLFVFIDAFGWEILQHYPFLDDILTTKAPLQTTFGYTSTCMPTILTGKKPQEHEHFSFFYYDPKNSPFALCRLLSILPKTITRRGRVRRLMSKFIGWFYGYTGYFQIYNMPFQYLHLFNYSEKKDIFEKGGIISGDPTIFDYLRKEKIPFHYSDWHLSEQENLNRLKQDLAKDKVSLAYLHLPAMDSILHSHGYPSQAVSDKIKWYEQKLREILALAQENYQEVNLYCYSDHGMAPVVEDCDLMSSINKLPYKFGKDYVAIYDSTMARFWFFKEEAKNEIIQVLNAEPKGSILTQAQLTLLECDFKEKKYGELFFLMDPGVLICPSFMGEKTITGMHGYSPQDKDSLAMFASNVVPKPLPNSLKDIFPLMKMGVQKEMFRS